MRERFTAVPCAVCRAQSAVQYHTTMPCTVAVPHSVTWLGVWICRSVGCGVMYSPSEGRAQQCALQRSADRGLPAPEVGVAQPGLCDAHTVRRTTAVQRTPPSHSVERPYAASPFFLSTPYKYMDAAATVKLRYQDNNLSRLSRQRWESRSHSHSSSVVRSPLCLYQQVPPHRRPLSVPSPPSLGVQGGAGP
jgi:hypothetical protein